MARRLSHEEFRRIEAAARRGAFEERIKATGRDMTAAEIAQAEEIESQACTGRAVGEFPSLVGTPCDAGLSNLELQFQPTSQGARRT